MQLPKLIAFPFLLVALAGCQSRQVVHYTSPEVMGRVLDAGTHKPLAGVHVRRPAPNNNFETFDPPKGGQLLMRPAPVLTDADGRFFLGSKSVFAPFRGPGWWSVPVTLQHSGYQTFQTNYTAASVITNAPAGPPVVDAGDILLRPSAR